MRVPLAHAADAVNANLRPAQPGNDLALRHGAYAVIHLHGRAAQIAQQIEAVVSIASEADRPLIEVLSMTLAQLERAHAVLAAEQRTELEQLQAGKRPTKAHRQNLQRLSADARGWANSARRMLEDLGCSPRSRAALGLDVARTGDVLAALRERYGGTP